VLEPEYDIPVIPASVLEPDTFKNPEVSTPVVSSAVVPDKLVAEIESATHLEPSYLRNSPLLGES
jgi:hypothetical protein